MMSEAMGFKAQKMMQKAEELDVFWAYDTHELPGRKKLVLLDNVQFIYELALAQMEMQALGVKFTVTNGLRIFELLEIDDVEKLRKRTAYLKAVETEHTDYFYILQKNRTRSVNQYLTHWIYPYKGKFHPQMIRALMNIIGLEEGDTVLDPFIGSGTTAVEAQLLGINCIGIDVSPLCVLQSRVKCESLYSVQKIIDAKEEISKRLKVSIFNDGGVSLDDSINSLADLNTRNFYKMVKLVAISDQARRSREFANSFIKNLEIMIQSILDYKEIVRKLNLKLGSIRIELGDSRELPVENESIDGIITSPPYSIALDYVDNDAHALKELGYDISEIREGFIGVRGKGTTKIRLYNNDMIQSLREMYRVLKAGKYAVIVIGNARYSGEEVKTVQFVIEHAEKQGLKLVKNIDKIIFGLYNVMQKENILIFVKQ